MMMICNSLKLLLLLLFLCVCELVGELRSENSALVSALSSAFFFHIRFVEYIYIYIYIVFLLSLLFCVAVDEVAAVISHTNRVFFGCVSSKATNSCRRQSRSGCMVVSAPTPVKNGQGREFCLRGGIYEGSFEEGARNGKGVLTYPDGSFYDGEWKAGKEHGIGMQYDAKKHEKYVGHFEEGHRCGFGTLIVLSPGQEAPKLPSTEGDKVSSPDDSLGCSSYSFLYKGEWKMDQPHGRGEALYPDGTRYEGDFLANKKSGFGKLVYAGGVHVYEGNFWRDEKHGHGVETFSSGATYDGTYARNERSGRGVYKYAEGTVYDGKWRHNKYHGRGVLRYANGDLYEGMFRDGMRSGQGKAVRANGSVYEGKWKNDKPHSCTCRVVFGSTSDAYKGYAEKGKIVCERQLPPRDPLRMVRKGKRKEKEFSDDETEYESSYDSSDSEENEIFF